MNDKITISQEDFIAEGSYCRCYGLPSDSSVCIKVPTENKKAKKRLKMDLYFYKKFHKKDVNLEFVSDYLGSCDTNLGEGYLYQCIRNHDGTIAQTLKSYINELKPEDTPPWDQLKGLGQYLYNNVIIISDLHGRNILVQKLEGGQIKLMIVDGIGDQVAIRVLNLFTSSVRAKITRRWNRFITTLMDRHSQYVEELGDLYLDKK